MSSYRWRDRELDNQLLLELVSKSPNAEHIREMVRSGADVNSTKNDESVLMDAIEMIMNGLDFRFIRLLVELGADVNFISADGDSPLITACFTHSPELVEYLLKLGANPNHIFDKYETPLSWVDSDKLYHERVDPDKKSVANLERIMELLRQYGAKHTDELFTDKISHWLTVFASYPAGLMTLWENIDIASIPGASDKLADDFRRWRTSHWDQWPANRWKEMPEDFDRRRHNEWGRRLANQVRQLLPENIKVEYLSINAEFEEKMIRNVNREDIARPTQPAAQGTI